MLKDRSRKKNTCDLELTILPICKRKLVTLTEGGGGEMK